MPLIQSQYAFVEHLLAERRRVEHFIRRTFSALRNCCDAGESEWPPEVLGGLVAIRGELAQHFDEEEAGGCLEEALAHCPALSSEARRVQAEHGDLLNNLDELVKQFRRCQQPTRCDVLALEGELRAVVRRLRLHDAEENRILERAFAVCLEDEDYSLCEVTTPI